jgi:CubicO group peptidase (beta-lactamase class C family)
MAKWDAALSSEKLLTKSSLNQIWTAIRTNTGADVPFNCGFGWFIDSHHGDQFVQHSGGTPGFSSVIYRFIDDHLTIIILTNHSDLIIDQLPIDIAGMYAPALKRPEGTPDPEPSTTAKTKQIMSELLKGNHDSTVFTAPMRMFLNTATGKAF